MQQISVVVQVVKPFDINSLRPHIYFMQNPTNINFEPPYRQLDPAARAMVDDLISRIESVSDLTGQALFDVLGAYVPTERERAFMLRPIVTAAIYERVRDLTEAQNISARRILKEISAIAFGNIDHFRKPEAYLNDPGGVFELEYATPEQRAAVKEVEIEESARNGTVKTKIKLHDKLAALRMLGQIQGLFDKDGNATNPDKWASGGGIVASASEQDAAEAYARFIGDG